MGGEQIGRQAVGEQLGRRVAQEANQQTGSAGSSSCGEVQRTGSAGSNSSADR